MTISIKDNVLKIKDIELENEFVCAYLKNKSVKEKKELFDKAVGLGFMALTNAKLGHFLHESHGQIGKEMQSLAALWELQELQFRETTGKGIKAEIQTFTALQDFLSIHFSGDVIKETGNETGRIQNNKTGDFVVTIEGQENRKIGIEVKVDKSMNLGNLETRDPSAKGDTTYSQLIETAANRGTDENIIVFDDETIDNSVRNACPQSITYLPEIGFIVVVGLRSNNFQPLTIAYSIARSMAIYRDKEFVYDLGILDLMVSRLIKIISDTSSSSREAFSIIKSARKIIEESEKSKLLIESFKDYLNHYLKEKTMSKEDLLSFYQGQGVNPHLDKFIKDLGKKIDGKNR